MPAAPPDPSQPISITVAPERAEVAVVPTGELDLASIDAAERAVRALGGAGLTEMVIDLRQVTFIDSAGLQRLISLRDDASRNGCTLTLEPGSRQVQRLFEVTGTRDLFNWRVVAPAPVRRPCERLDEVELMPAGAA